jgi:hypothetical protein
MTPRTTTKYTDFQTLLARGKSAIMVIKLMMACNDLSLANDALGQWKKEQQLSRKARQTGAGMYFVRTQLAHLYEGLKVIEEIRKKSSLLAKVKKCDFQTQESFQNLEQFLPGGLKRLEFEKLVGKVRHNLTFHYNQSDKLIRRAISDRAARSEARHSSITCSDTAYLWYFKVADDIVDSIVVRQIWDIPRSADLRVEADKVADYVHQIFVSFMDFSTKFIWKYFED